MKLRLFLSTVMTTALVAALVAPAIAADKITTTNAPAYYSASGAKVASIYQGWYGKTGIKHVIVQRQVSDYFEATEATEATVTVKCEVLKVNGVDTKVVFYNNKVTPGDTARWIDWGPNRPCEKILAVFVRATPGDLDGDSYIGTSYPGDPEDVALAVERLSSGEYRPMRISIRHDQ